MYKNISNDEIIINEIPIDKVNLLFGALIITSLFVFFGGNLLLLNKIAFYTSFKIAINSTLILLIFYFLSFLFKNIPLALVSTYFILLAIVYFQSDIIFILYYLLESFSFLFFIYKFRINYNTLKSLILMSISSTIIILGCLHSYTSFDMLNRISVGHVHQDTLFHSSISAMIKNYQITSTGLNGLVETPNHALSHALIASVSLLTGVGVIEVYGVLPFVFFAPLLIFSVTIFCLLISKKFSIIVSERIWIIVCFLMMISSYLFYYWGASDEFFVSESYEVSLAIFMLGFIYLFKIHLSVFEMFIILLTTLIITFSKSSVGMIYVFLWGVRFLIYKSDKFILNLIFTFVLFLTLYFSLYSVAKSQINSNTILISPLNFIENYSFLGKYLTEFKNNMILNKFNFLVTLFMLLSVISFFFIHFAFSWIIIFNYLIYKKEKLKSFPPNLIYIIASLLISVLIVLFFSIPGGSSIYFTNVTYFITLPFIVLLIYNYTSKVSAKLFSLIILAPLFILAFPGFFQKSVLNPKRKYNSEISDFVRLLYDSRKTDILNVTIKTNSDLLSKNPIKHCTTSLFVYPALTERPWTGLFNENSNCKFYYYGFNQYGIDQTSGLISKIQPPKLINNMKLIPWDLFIKHY